MSAMTEERQDPRTPVPASIRRPASGISIDPARLTWWRESRALSREDLSEAITALHLIDEDDEPLTVTRDAIAKIENGERRPKARTVRALCAALSTDGDPCTPRDLMPGGTPLAPHLASAARRSRLDYNKDLRQFAVLHGVRYRNPGSGRVYYSRPLRDAYDLSVSGAPAETVAEAVAIARGDGGEAIYGITADDRIDALDLSQRAHNALISGDIRTVGQLAGHTAVQLRSLRDFGTSALAEVRGRLAAAGFALDGEELPNPPAGEPPVRADRELLAS